MGITGNNLEEITMIEVLEITKWNLESPAEYAQKPLTQTSLDAQSSKSIFQANQGDQVASLGKFANYALEQPSETVCITVWRNIKITSAKWQNTLYLKLEGSNKHHQ